MNFIHKQDEPEEFARWRKKHPKKKFKNMPGGIKKILQNALMDEQGYVCCFCGASIGRIEAGSRIIQAPLSKGDSHNVRAAHIEPQSVNKAMVLDYDNICASCDSSLDGEQHCDIAQKAHVLPVSPLDQDCLSFFSYDILGNIFPNKHMGRHEQRMAEKTIKILGLQSPTLVLKRQKAINILLKAMEANISFLSNDNIEKIMMKNKKGVFMEFYFVLYKYIKDNMRG